MSVGNLKNEGGKGTNYPYQYAVLKLLDQISNNISALPGVDYETRTSMYQAIAAGPGYSIGDIIVRYDIISVPTGTVSATVWFNQTTQAVIAAPAPANITPIAAPSSVTVINGVGGAAVNIQDGGNSITVDNSFLDAAISTLLTTAAFQARINTLGQKTMVGSTPVVLASDQSSIPVTIASSGATYTPSIASVGAGSVGSTTAGVKEVSIQVRGDNAAIGGISVANGTIVTFHAPEGSTVNSIAYTTGVNTTLLISYLS